MENLCYRNIAKEKEPKTSSDLSYLKRWIKEFYSPCLSYYEKIDRSFTDISRDELEETKRSVRQRQKKQQSLSKISNLTNKLQSQMGPKVLTKKKIFKRTMELVGEAVKDLDDRLGFRG